MKKIASVAILLFTTSNLFAQINCNPKDFKQLLSISKRTTVTNAEFANSLQIVKKLDAKHCTDYSINRNGTNSVVAGLTELFGKICLKNNSLNAVKEYVNYMKKHSGSAEEEISFSFERLFVNQPEYVLSIIGNDKRLLNHLEWGFVNNHYYSDKDQVEVTRDGRSANIKPQLNQKTYKEIFYKINPKVKSIYPKYNKQIDYLLNAICEELKG